MARKRGTVKRIVAKVERPADYAMRPEDYRDSEAMTGVGNGRTVVTRRVTPVQRLHNRGEISRAQLAGLEAYHDAWAAARVDGTRSCFAGIIGGGGGSYSGDRLTGARMYESALRSGIPLHCLNAVDAVLIGGQGIEQVAASRVPSGVRLAPASVSPIHRVRTERRQAVVFELQQAGDALADKAKVAA